MEREMGHIVAAIMERFEDSLCRKKWYFGITVKGVLSSEILSPHKRDVWRVVHKMISTEKSLRTFRGLLYREIPKVTYIYIKARAALIIG